jgi:hypothetical protein
MWELNTNSVSFSNPTAIATSQAFFAAVSISFTRSDVSLMVQSIMGLQVIT